MTFKRTALNSRTGRNSTGADTGKTAADWARLLAFADRACCCAARPKVVAVLPPTSTRPYPTDLLLCRHHYRSSEAALADQGATAYDETGALIAPAEEARDLLPAGAV